LDADYVDLYIPILGGVPHSGVNYYDVGGIESEPGTEKRTESLIEKRS